MRYGLLLLLIVVVTFTTAQVRPRVKEPRTNSLIDNVPRREPQQVKEIQSLFARIEQGIAQASVTSFGAHFGKQVSMTVSGSESGFVSAGQAVSILQNFFSSRKPTQFAFTRLNEATANPYATGRMNFHHKGNKESVQIYVSLTRQESEWVITQFNIY